jgi:hypothetical protein
MFVIAGVSTQADSSVADVHTAKRRGVRVVYRPSPRRYRKRPRGARRPSVVATRLNRRRRSRADGAQEQRYPGAASGLGRVRASVFEPRRVGASRRGRWSDVRRHRVRRTRRHDGIERAGQRLVGARSDARRGRSLGHTRAQTSTQGSTSPFTDSPRPAPPPRKREPRRRTPRRALPDASPRRGR